MNSSPEPAAPRTLDTTPDDEADMQRQLTDLDWVRTMLDAGKFDQYAGKYIAVYTQAVVAHGDDPIEVKQAAAQKYNIHTGQLVLRYIEPMME